MTTRELSELQKLVLEARRKLRSYPDAENVDPALMVWGLDDRDPDWRRRAQAFAVPTAPVDRMIHAAQVRR